MLRRMSLSLATGLAALVPPAAAQTLIWEDEFEGTTLSSDWEPMIGTGTDYGLPAGWGNNEQQYYTDRPENVYLDGNGFLHIVARAESYNGSNYTSARLRTRGEREFRYGRIEARIKLPGIQGIWPAFWMLPTASPYGGWAASGEIDIMESVNAADRIYGTIHHGGQWPSNVHDGGEYAPGTDFAADFHVYTIDWNPDVIQWYVDGVQYHLELSTNWFSENAPGNDRAPFDTPFHLLLNVAVGGNFPGPPNGSNGFPTEMVVDWVRAYDLTPNPQRPFGGTAWPVPGRVEAEDYDIGGPSVAYLDCDQENRGGAYRENQWVDIEAASEGGFNVGYVCPGEWLEFTVAVAADGPYRVDVRVASQATGGAFRLELDEQPLAQPLTVPVTGGWQTWQTVSTVVDLPAGEHELRWANTSPGGQEYNLNWIELTALDSRDLDRDGDVDSDDALQMVACVAGPGVLTPPAGIPPAVFAQADDDGDFDVDLVDLAGYQRRFD